MKNLRIKRGILSVLFAGTVLTTLSGCNKKETKIEQENIIGHIDIHNPKEIPSSDFIYYNVGNYKKIGISDQDKKLEECEKRDISTGIIIDSTATTRLDIFEDIEFTKSIIENNKIDMPVYLNIEKIMANDELSMTEKTCLIKEFLTLAEENNIYIGLYGTSKELSLLDQYGTKISNTYDCFVVEDETTKYEGKSSIRQDKDGNIKSTYKSVENENNLSKLIKKANKNNKNNLKQNGYYILDENCDIERVAIKYDLSVNDILKFNNITRKELKKDMVLRIPNTIQNETKMVYPTLDRTDECIYKGIDISYYQGESNKINFKELSKKIDFAILKIGEQENKNFKELREDKYFNDYYLKCKENNISIGGYYITHATTTNEAIEEAKLIVNRVKNLNIEFPIYIDYENIADTIYETEFEEIKQNNEFETMIKEINSIFEEAGLRFGIYTNLSTYEEMINMVGLKTLEQYEIWLSKPNEYTDIAQVIDYGPICKTDDEKYLYGCDMNQVSWKINNLGIGNDQGFVDYNLCYKDYKAKKEQIDLPPRQRFATKEYKRTDTKNILRIVQKAAGTTIEILFIIYVVGHRKKIKKKIRKLIHIQRQKTKLQPNIKKQYIKQKSS